MKLTRDSPGTDGDLQLRPGGQKPQWGMSEGRRFMPVRSLWFPLGIGGAIVASAWAIQGCLSTASAQKRIPPVTASLRVEQAQLHLGDIADVTLRLAALAPATRVEAVVILPPQMAFVSGSQSWTGSMTANQVEEVRLRLRLVAPGRYTLGARVAMAPGGGASEETAGAVLYFLVTPSRVIWGPDPASLPASPEAPQGTAGSATPGAAVPQAPTPGRPPNAPKRGERRMS